ncbi:MAG: hypothetical protein R8P61_24600 [Bacteroidia bacterium]|nr:hypothetical protein [Bacteroidia bacterium]
MDLGNLWPDIDQLLMDVAQELQKLILSQSDQIVEDVGGGAKVKMTLYSIGRKDNVLAVIGMGKDHCKLYLHHTDKIDTRELVLQGKGKHAKTLWIRNLHEMDRESINFALEQITQIALEKA